MRRSNERDDRGRDEARREAEVKRAEEVVAPEAEERAGPASEQPTSTVEPRTEEPAEEAAEAMPQAPAAPTPAVGGPEPERARTVRPERAGEHPAERERAAAGERAAAALRGPKRRRLQERLIGGMLFTAAAVSILTTLGIIVVLVTEAADFFAEVSPVEFLTGTQWTPLFQPQSFGVVPLLVGSLQIAAGAAAVALPLGLASAVYLSEYAPDRVRRVVKPALEVLAGVPTVVYGYFALTFVTPLIRQYFPETNIFNAASASLVVGIMIIPMVSSLSEDAMSAVPRSLREAAYALGATKLEVSVRTVVPAALSGIVASFILAVSRAIGETMIVTIAAGATPNLTANPLESIQTMTAYIVQVSMGEVAFGTVEYQTIFAVGLFLFVLTLAMNIGSSVVLRRFREVYE